MSTHSHSHPRHQATKPGVAGTTPDQKRTSEITLQPCDFFFGQAGARVRTLLGSCVSITLWHPRLCIGGMCHFMLPQRNIPRHGQLDGKYADEAMEMFLLKIRSFNTRPAEYEVKVFGGGNMFPEINCQGSCKPGSALDEIKSCRNIACKNIAMTHHLLNTHGFYIKREDLGGDNRRHILFDIGNGHVWVRNATNAKEPCLI